MTRSQLPLRSVLVAALVALAAAGAAPGAADAATFVSSLVRTTDTSKWSPASPDPSGITYVPAKGTLVVVDGEVEETVSGITHFKGVNVWETSLAGSVLSTANISKVAPTSTPMTNEPTGIAYKPSNGHYFVSDDDAQRVYDLNPGADGRIGTSDDTFTSFSTSTFGNTDPEGITYDPQHDRLYVADGEGYGSEIFEYTTTGTFVQHFDVARYGVADPESVDYDPATGTLFVLSNSSNRIIVETTTTGTLLQTIDVSASQSTAPAGLAIAPASDGSGARRFYIVDRGIDNDSHPTEVDGRMFEMTAPQTSSPPPSNVAPSVSAGPDLSVTLPASASLDGTVSDDGLPNGTLTSTWSKVSGPGTVTFANPAAVDTTASFSAAGSYVLRLTASDGALSASDDVTVDVQPSSGGGGTGTTLDIPVNRSSDDAEQSSGGSVSLTSSDLELVTDGSTVQTVGIRFTGITIPRGATITSAWIQFQTDEVSTGATSLTLRAQAADNAATFTTTANNVSSRTRTTASAAWTPPAWNTVGERGTAQRTPDLSPLVQEVVNRAGWTSGNALALIITGTGRRTAGAYDEGVPPLLHLTYVG